MMGLVVTQNEEQQQELGVYTCLEAGDGGAARRSCLHLVLSPPEAAMPQISERWAASGVVSGGSGRVVRCSLPAGMDLGNTVRSIVSLQGHNNCGRLYGELHYECQPFWDFPMKQQRQCGFPPGK